MSWFGRKETPNFFQRIEKKINVLGIGNSYNSGIIIKGLREKKVNKMLQDVSTKLLQQIESSGKDVTNVVDKVVDIVCTKFVGEIGQLKEQQKTSVEAITKAVQEKFDIMLGEQDIFAEKISSEIEAGKHWLGNLDQTLEKLCTVYENSAEQTITSLGNILDELHELKTDVDETRKGVDKANESLDEIKNILIKSNPGIRLRLRNHGRIHIRQPKKDTKLPSGNEEYLDLQKKIEDGTYTLKDVAFTIKQILLKQSFPPLEKLYLSGNETPKVQKLYNKAKAGKAFEQDMLADKYYYGQGVNRDYALAAAWYYHSAVQGFMSGMYDLGDCFYNGKGVNTNVDLGFLLITVSAISSNARAQEHLARIYYYRYKDIDKAIKWFEEAALQGNNSANNNLQSLYERGRI